MNSLSYSNKFTLIASLIAVPLIMIATSLAIQFHTSVERVQEQQIGLQHIRLSTELIRELENLRDNHVLAFLTRAEDIDFGFNKTQEQTLALINKIEASPELYQQQGTQDFIKNLKEEVSSLGIAPGMEAVRVVYLFDNAELRVEKARTWRVSLENKYNITSSADQNITVLINLIFNDMGRLSKPLGRARTYGTYYLTQHYISSNGASALDATDQTLNHEIKSLSIKLKPITSTLQTRHASPAISAVIRALKSTRSLLDDKLVQSLELNYDPHLYYNTVTQDIEQVHIFIEGAFDIIDATLNNIYKEKINSLKAFYISVATIGFLFIYLYIGFFYSVKLNIKTLMRSANKVANGDYLSSIRVSSEDELKLLSITMDHMRQQLSAREHKLKELSITDGLTNLKNRKYFDDTLEIEVAKSNRSNTPISLIMLDIDHFKSINDNYGHQAGDICLIEASKTLTDLMRRKSDLVARYGGEEFIILLPNTNKEHAKALSELIRVSISQLKVETENTIINFTASLGITTIIPPAHFNHEKLITVADSALYISKEQGRNRCTFKPVDLDNA